MTQRPITLPALPTFMTTNLCGAMQEWCDADPGDDAAAAFKHVVTRFGQELRRYAHTAVEADREAGRSAPVAKIENGRLIWCKVPLGTDALLYAGSAPVAWREHVEQRLRAWRQRFVNKSGDQLALDDFMDLESLDDLLDYVLDEWADPGVLVEDTSQLAKDFPPMGGLTQCDMGDSYE